MIDKIRLASQDNASTAYGRSQGESNEAHYDVYEI